jgi:hypothetical protein
LKLIAALSLTAAALVTASLAAPLGAQVPADKNNDKTRVYAYEKRQAETPPAAVVAPQKRQTPTPSYSSEDIPFGAQNWWREREQLSGGSGGE